MKTMISQDPCFSLFPLSICLSPLPHPAPPHFSASRSQMLRSILPPCPRKQPLALLLLSDFFTARTWCEKLSPCLEGSRALVLSLSCGWERSGCPHPPCLRPTADTRPAKVPFSVEPVCSFTRASVTKYHILCGLHTR